MESKSRDHETIETRTLERTCQMCPWMVSARHHAVTKVRFSHRLLVGKKGAYLFVRLHLCVTLKQDMQKWSLLPLVSSAAFFIFFGSFLFGSSALLVDSARGAIRVSYDEDEVMKASEVLARDRAAAAAESREEAQRHRVVQLAEEFEKKKEKQDPYFVSPVVVQKIRKKDEELNQEEQIAAKKAAEEKAKKDAVAHEEMLRDNADNSFREWLKHRKKEKPAKLPWI